MFEDNVPGKVFAPSSGAYRFSKNRKLKTDEISSVFDFRRQFSSEYLRFLVRPNQLPIARFAVIAGKKIVRKAVDRNYCKRVVRELFRERQNCLSGMDLVVQVKRRFITAEFPHVARDFDYLLSLLDVKAILPRVS